MQSALQRVAMLPLPSRGWTLPTLSRMCKHNACRMGYGTAVAAKIVRNRAMNDTRRHADVAPATRRRPRFWVARNPSGPAQPMPKTPLDQFGHVPRTPCAPSGKSRRGRLRIAVGLDSMGADAKISSPDAAVGQGDAARPATRRSTNLLEGPPRRAFQVGGISVGHLLHLFENLGHLRIRE
jgi:hypothetical protein